MTYKEAIDIIEIAIAEVEWDYPLDYAIAFEKAIEVLKEKAEKEESNIMCNYYKQIILHNADGEALKPNDVCFGTKDLDPCNYTKCFSKCVDYVPKTETDNRKGNSDE